tara:strand:+ start:169083 stop:170912 length:1830 start_codon:yes stop_codon:yes gene_type:complete
MSIDPPVKLRLPRQDLQGFDAFPLSAAGARNWVLALPATSSSQVAQQLAAVLGELNRIELAPELRYNILEELRRPLLIATASLSRRFLKQPLIMPAEPRYMAELADELLTAAGTAYTIAAVHAIQRRDSIREVNPARLVCESIHRATRFAGARILQTFQLYRPVALYGWLALHQLYALAEGQRLTQLTVEDDLSGSGTITTAYMQALILGCCKPNQLRQNDLAAIFRGLQEWGALIKVEQQPKQHGLFLVDLDSDRPPLYSQLYHKSPGPRARYIDTDPLEQHLQKLLNDDSRQSVVFDKDTVIGPVLLDHLVASFSKMSMRNFTRRQVSRTMWLSVGFNACHFYMGGEKNFEQVVFGSQYISPSAQRPSGNPFLHEQNKGDLWQQANPQKDFSGNSYTPRDEKMSHEVALDQQTLAALAGENDDDLSDAQRYEAHQIMMIDASPGGYCLEWTAELPADIKTGDLVCVREEENPRWAIAAIRWVSQVDNDKTLLGLELLSPEAKPYGARMQPQKKGEDAEPIRVMLLPEINLVGQPPTLITPRAGFRERQKIVLARHDEEYFIQLQRQVAVTGAFAQFEFRHIKQLDEVLAEDKSRPRDSRFDSLWTNI